MFNELMGFPGSSAGKKSACNSGDPGSVPGWGRSPGEGTGCPCQYSQLSWWLRWQRIHLQCGRLGLSPWLGRSPGGGHGCPLQCSCLENPMDTVPGGCKESDRTDKAQHDELLRAALVAHSVKDLPVMPKAGSIPGPGRAPGEENGSSLQYSCLETPHGQRSLAGYIAHGVSESQTRLSN